jgi:hypothetical protein
MGFGAFKVPVRSEPISIGGYLQNAEYLTDLLFVSIILDIAINFDIASHFSRIISVERQACTSARVFISPSCNTLFIFLNHFVTLAFSSSRVSEFKLLVDSWSKYPFILSPVIVALC